MRFDDVREGNETTADERRSRPGASRGAWIRNAAGAVVGAAGAGFAHVASAQVQGTTKDGGNVGYCGMGAFGMYVLDLTDITKPKVFGHVRHQLEALGGILFDTCYPVLADAAHPRLQELVVGVFESLESDCREPYHTSYVVDVKHPRSPKIIGLFPRPDAPPDAPYADFCQVRGRFSAHNCRGSRRARVGASSSR